MDKLKLDIQRFAATPPTAGNLIDEECLYEYHQNIERDYAKKGSNNNFSASQSINGDLTVSGKFACSTPTRNTTDTWIPVLKSGVFEYTKRKFFTSKTHTNYNNDQDEVATMSVLSWWNGAYGSNNASNLTYAHQGEIQCKPVQLYNNATGTNGNVTLSSSAANYTYLEIFYRGNDNQYSSVKVFEPNGKNVSLLVSLTNNSQIYFKQKIVNISGTSISNANYSQARFNASSQGWTNDNYIYITRVIGYY